MSSSAPDPLIVLQSNSAFARLPAAELARLAEAAKTDHYRQATLLVPRGTAAPKIWYVASGSVDLTLTSAGGGVARLPVTQGYWATWAGCFGSQPLQFDFWSSRAATLIAFPRDKVLQAFDRQPDALLQVIEFLAENVTVFNAWILSTTILSAEQRLAYLLLVLSARAKAAGSEALEVTQEQLGMLGIGTRQRVSRLLGGLAKRGLIRIENGKIVILSRRRLEELAL